MISIILSWMVIAILSYLFGKTAIRLCYRNEGIVQSLDFYLICGIVILNEYAQIWSLFGGVGKAAVLCLIIPAFLCGLWLFWKGWLFDHRQFGRKIPAWRWILLAIGFAAVLIWTDLTPQHYDTYLYHAQAIHWVEEYGLVPGLGNLHCRLAYNSAFMTLQALFSFAWISGQSLHTMNGFVTLLMFIYCVLTCMKHEEKRLYASDCMKLFCMAYMIVDSYFASSPNSDMLTMYLVFYLGIKWSEFLEGGEHTSTKSYGLLCVLAVYAVTLKLSAAALVLFAIYPAVLMIRQKLWKQIAAHIAVGVSILCPFFARNILISGYLVYPYYEVDLFDFDWKIPRSVLMSDRAGIIAWARLNFDTERISEPIYLWIGQWFRNINPLWKALFLLAVIAGIYLLIRTIIELKRKDYAQAIRDAVSIAGFLFWLFTAPMPRYGGVYMLVVIAVALSTVLDRPLQMAWCQNAIRPFVKAGMYGIVLGYCLFYGVYCHINDCDGVPTILLQKDYADKTTEVYLLDGIEIAYPIEDDRSGYYPFPSAPSKPSDSLELRGDTLKNGFRTKG